MKSIFVNGINLAFTRRGKGIPLMLVHGFPLDSSIWSDIIPLLENEFDLLVPDLRGFGQSTTIESLYTISDMADDLAGMMDHAGVEKTAIAGHSMGGYVALAFLKKYPYRVSGLGLVSSQAAEDSPDRKEGRYKTAADVAENGVGVVVDAMTSKLSTDMRVQSFVREVIGAQNKAAIIGALKAMAVREDSNSLLTSFNHPLVLVHGDFDTLISIERSKEIKAVIPSAHYVELNGAGHMPMMEFPNETADALHFLAN